MGRGGGGRLTPAPPHKSCLSNKQRAHTQAARPRGLGSVCQPIDSMDEMNRMWLWDSLPGLSAIGSGVEMGTRARVRPRVPVPPA